MRHDRGFSILELLVVLGVLLLLSAIAALHVEAARRHAQEAAATASLRAIVAAEEIYVTLDPSHEYADDLSKLGSARLLDSTLGCAAQPCLRDGWKFYLLGEAADLPGAPVLGYRAVAIPVDAPAGEPALCSDSSGIFQADPGGGALCGQMVARRTDASINLH